MKNIQEISDKILKENFIDFTKSSKRTSYLTECIGKNSVPKLHLFHIYKQNFIPDADEQLHLLYLGSNDKVALFLRVSMLVTYVTTFEIKDIKFNRFFGNKNNFKYEKEKYFDEGYKPYILKDIMNGNL